MKITKPSMYQADLPLEHPYWLSGGARDHGARLAK
jgi:hypothetical protein